MSYRKAIHENNANFFWKWFMEYEEAIINSLTNPERRGIRAFAIIEEGLERAFPRSKVRLDFTIGFPKGIGFPDGVGIFLLFNNKEEHGPMAVALKMQMPEELANRWRFGLPKQPAHVPVDYAQFL